MLRRFESASECNILNWQVGKLQKFLGYGKSVMPNVFDWRHAQFGFEYNENAESDQTVTLGDAY